MIRSVLIVVGIALLMGLLSSVAMRVINRKMNISDVPGDETALQSGDPNEGQGQDSLRIVEFNPGEYDLSLQDVSPWDARWPVAPCSVYVTASSAPVVDTIPSAESPDLIPVETQFLVESWGRASGLEETELERLWAFNSYDTLYIDMPRALDVDGLKKTIESRFVCYTLLVPIVNGVLSEGSGAGIPLAGVPGVFPRR
jgi:hypothetical protein